MHAYSSDPSPSSDLQVPKLADYLSTCKSVEEFIFLHACQNTRVQNGCGCWFISASRLVFWPSYGLRGDVCKRSLKDPRYNYLNRSESYHCTQSNSCLTQVKSKGGHKERSTGREKAQASTVAHGRIV